MSTMNMYLFFEIRHNILMHFCSTSKAGKSQIMHGKLSSFLLLVFQYFKIVYLVFVVFNLNVAIFIHL